LGNLHNRFKEDVNKKIKAVLKLFTAAEIFTLGTHLREDSDGFEIVKMNSGLFEASLNDLRTIGTANVNITNVLSNLQGTDYTKEERKKLQKDYDYVNRTLDSLVKGVLNSRDLSQYLEHQVIAKIKALAIAVETSDNGKVIWDGNARARSLELLPYIFAVKTLQSSNLSWQPHPTQVVAILRLLSIDVVPYMWSNDVNNLNNHLLQIGTGEGKSITLAVAASLLALLGFDVNIACYSDYLSRRDQNEFNSLFSALGIADDRHFRRAGGKIHQSSRRCS
jgi:hypothetical protein